MRWIVAVAAIVVIVAAFAIPIALIGNGDDAEAKETDGAFIAGMIPHHQMAIEMAEMAQERAKHPEIEEMAGAVIEAQSEEIDELSAIHEDLFGEPVAQGDHGTLGLPASEMGMDMEMSMLEDAKRFDQMFIDMMVPHHQGAIRMARIELAEGEDSRLQELSTAIIDAQSREIEQMNEWRAMWYGSPSAAGGVPSEDDASVPSHEAMGH